MKSLLLSVCGSDPSENGGPIVDPTTELVTGSPHLALKSSTLSFPSSMPPPLQLQEDDASGLNLASISYEESTKY
ncbi:hypothetical protein U1Q18_048726 [Sarracenia purpurea var. burkii]